MNIIQKYFRHRQSLIDQYVKGDMSKAEYLERNFEAVLSLNIKPFKNIDTVEKGLFNYQYYNAMAKNAKVQAEAMGDRLLADEMLGEVNFFYTKKDKATLSVLRLLDFRGVTAYFIKVRSKYLKGILFEIVIEEYGMILHSANKMILNCLKDEGVFLNETRQSLIDGYINQKY